jgi:acyl-CoA thioester hydrolase
MQSHKYSKQHHVTEEWLDENNHVGNIEYIKLLLDIAAEHCDSVGCTSATESMGAAWFVRSHFIEYKRPMALGQDVMLTTWIDETDTLRSTRKYVFEQIPDGQIFAEARTEWILVDVKSGRPKRIPADLIQLFTETPA